jgi:alpha-tubulin suppressor-like RCC1 family protein
VNSKFTFRSTTRRITLAILTLTALATSLIASEAQRSVKLWGYDKHGQLGNGGPNDGNRSTRPVLTQKLNGVLNVSAGHNFCLALKSDGTVWSYGEKQSRAVGQRNQSG